MPFKPALLAAFLLAAATPLTAQAPRLGPLTSEEGGPFQRLAYTPMMEAADLVPVGSIRTDLWIGYANIFEQDSSATHIQYVDLERMITALTVRWGVHERLELGTRITLETDWGGILDSYVEVFHISLALGNRNRPEFPHRQCGQTLEARDGPVLVDIPCSALAVDDVRFFGKWQAARSADGRSALSVRAVGRIPTQENRVGAESGDVGVMLLGRTAWRRLTLHALLGGSTVRRSPGLADVLVGRKGFYGLGIEYPLRPDVSGVLQFTGESQILREVGDHDIDGTPTNMSLGVVGAAEEGWRWQVSIQEDWPPRGPSLDFTLQFALSRAW